MDMCTVICLSACRNLSMRYIWPLNGWCHKITKIRNCRGHVYRHLPTRLQKPLHEVHLTLKWMVSWDYKEPGLPWTCVSASAWSPAETSPWGTILILWVQQCRLIKEPYHEIQQSQHCCTVDSKYSNASATRKTVKFKFSISKFFVDICTKLSRFNGPFKVQYLNFLYYCQSIRKHIIVIK